MTELHLPNNLKVHFASGEMLTDAIACKLSGVKYSLWSIYSCLAPKFDLPFYPQIPRIKDGCFVPGIVTKLFKHNIMDSGIFTLMYGSQGGRKDCKFMDRWFHSLCEFVLENNIDTTVIEVDCQKVLGVEEAWKYRKLIRELLPKHRQINVFHLEDGKKGLDALIDFSDYIAFALTELRVCRRNDYKDFLYRLVSYTKSKKPEIDIHLLGCTEAKILKQCKFCTSSDSTSYKTPMKYGTFVFSKNKLRNLNTALVPKVCECLEDFKLNFQRYYKTNFQKVSFVMKKMR